MASELEQLPAEQAELRRRAEVQVGPKPSPTEAEAPRLLHELQVHQIELEMQNAELRESRAEAEASLQRYADLYDFAPVGYLTLDVDGTIRQANLAAEGLLGVSRSQLYRKRFGAFVSDDTRVRFNAFLVRAFADHRQNSVEVVLRRTERYPPVTVHVTATADADGQTCRVALVDLTGLKHAEDKWRNLHENLRDAFATVDMSGYIREFNQAYCRLLGYTAEELSGLTFRDITPTQWHAFEDGIIREQVFPRGYSDVYEKEHRRKDGQVIPVELRTYLVRDEAGVPAGMWAVIRDITERKRIEQELAQQAVLLTRQAEQLRESDRRKDEFLAMLGHELRNPLAPIVMATAALEQRGASDPALLPWAIGIIKKQSQHLVCLVDELLDVARVSQGKITLSKRPIEMRAWLAGVSQACRPLIDQHRQIFEQSLPAEPLWVEADDVRLTQAVSNLLENAVKYTPEGGRIGLGLQGEDDSAVIRLRDTGIGIAESMLPRVFDLFTQGEGTRGRSQEGLGVGLALAKRLIELHGGSIEAFSTGLGQGSEFVLRLPRLRLMPEAATAIEQDVPQAASVSSPRRILVVDDQLEIVASMAVLLETMGHQVWGAHDGEDALAIAKTQALDVVLLDIGLPGLDGHEVARRLRLEPGLTHLTLIAITGYGTAFDREASYRAGFDQHLVKPVTPRELAEILEQGLRSRPS